MSIPANALGIYANVLVKLFMYHGFHASVDYTLTFLEFNRLFFVVGYSMLLPLGSNGYLRPSLDISYSEGDQSDSRFLTDGYTAPADATGVNKLAGLALGIGMGTAVPLSQDLFIHLGMSQGLGADFKQMLNRDEGYASTMVLCESSFSQPEIYLHSFAWLGLAVRLFGTIVLDSQTGIEGRTYGLSFAHDMVSGADIGGFFLVPLRLAMGLVY